jgi:hypothetical protein
MEPLTRGYRPQIPGLSALCPQLNLLNHPREKISWVRYWWETNCSMRTDRHDEANSRFSQFCLRALKIIGFYWVVSSLHSTNKRPIFAIAHFRFLALRACMGGRYNGVISSGLSFIVCPPHETESARQWPATLLQEYRYRMSAITHPSSDHHPCSLTALLASEGFTNMATPFEALRIVIF